MRTLSTKKLAWPVCALLTLLIGLLPAVQIAAQSEATAFTDTLVAEVLHETLRTPATELPAVQAAPAAATQVYLPLMSGGAAASVQMAAALDADQNPVNPSHTFAYGITELFAVLKVHNSAGKPWTIEWYRNGLRIPGTTSRGTLPANTESVRMVRRLAYANSGRLPAGTYKMVLYVDGVKTIEAEALIAR